MTIIKRERILRFMDTLQQRDDTFFEQLKTAQKILDQRRVNILVESQGGENLLSNMVPRNLVGEHDFGFWFAGDVDMPRLHLSGIFEAFIPIDEILEYWIV